MKLSAPLLAILVIISGLTISAQSPAVFSELSNLNCRDFSSVEVDEGYVFRLRSVTGNITTRTIYKINHSGIITDSLSLDFDEYIYTGWVLEYNNRVFFTGLRNLDPNIYPDQETVVESQEKFLLELDDDLAIINFQTYDIVPAGVGFGPVVLIGTTQLIVDQPSTHRIQGDTLYSVNLFDAYDAETLTPIGRRVQFEKLGLQGQVFEVKEQLMNVGSYFSSEITDERMYVFGDVGTILPSGDLFDVQPVGQYDLNGNIISPFPYDEVFSAAFGAGSTGQFHEGVLFTSYYGEFPLTGERLMLESLPIGPYLFQIVDKERQALLTTRVVMKK